MTISAKWSTFVTHVIKEIADVKENTPENAMIKHAQTIQTFERTHVSLEKSIKIETAK